MSLCQSFVGPVLRGCSVGASLSIHTPWAIFAIRERDVQRIDQCAGRNAAAIVQKARALLSRRKERDSRAKKRESEHSTISRFSFEGRFLPRAGVYVRLRMQTCRTAYAVGESLDDP